MAAPMCTELPRAPYTAAGSSRAAGWARLHEPPRHSSVDFATSERSRARQPGRNAAGRPGRTPDRSHNAAARPSARSAPSPAGAHFSRLSAFLATICLSPGHSRALSPPPPAMARLTAALCLLGLLAAAAPLARATEVCGLPLLSFRRLCAPSTRPPGVEVRLVLNCPATIQPDPRARPAAERELGQGAVQPRALRLRRLQRHGGSLAGRPGREAGGLRACEVPAPRAPLRAAPTPSRTCLPCAALLPTPGSLNLLPLAPLHHLTTTGRSSTLTSTTTPGWSAPPSRCGPGGRGVGRSRARAGTYMYGRRADTHSRPPTLAPPLRAVREL